MAERRTTVYLPRAETFTPPTGKMGYGNVDNALALAEAVTEPVRGRYEKDLPVCVSVLICSEVGILFF